ncbi:hypothetical protein PUN28_016276 [Cardiocondyla obscurior]|uniref:Uncharacterized protein n=1 Tax=Cardiocondyla obscurior TaxID=286306 RepID=A0AAW2ESX6_9HYME
MALVLYKLHKCRIFGASLLLLYKSHLYKSTARPKIIASITLLLFKNTFTLYYKSVRHINRKKYDCKETYLNMHRTAFNSHSRLSLFLTNRISQLASLLHRHKRQFQCQEILYIIFHYPIFPLLILSSCVESQATIRLFGKGSQVPNFREARAVYFDPSFGQLLIRACATWK